MAHEPDLPPTGAAFEVVRRGYDQGQVDNHLRWLDTKIQILVTDREAALDQSAQLARELDDARGHAEQLRVQVRGLVNSPQSVQGWSCGFIDVRVCQSSDDEAGEIDPRVDALQQSTRSGNVLTEQHLPQQTRSALQDLRQVAALLPLADAAARARSPLRFVPIGAEAVSRNAGCDRPAAAPRPR
jgi:cell division septum initiation protein DivIVA